MEDQEMNQLEMADPSLTGAKNQDSLLGSEQPWMRSMLTHLSTTLATIIPHFTNQRQKRVKWQVHRWHLQEDSQDKPSHCSPAVCSKHAYKSHNDGDVLHKMFRTHKPKDAESRIVTA